MSADLYRRRRRGARARRRARPSGPARGTPCNRRRDVAERGGRMRQRLRLRANCALSAPRTGHSGKTNTV